FRYSKALSEEMLAVTLCIPTCLRVFQLTREFFTKELKKHYVRNNDTDVFSSTWNSVMITFACCGVNGPEDFDAVLPLPHLPLEKTIPEACCQRKLQSREGMIVNRQACLDGTERFQNRQGCYTVILNSFETYVYLAGALAIGVLAIEVLLCDHKSSVGGCPAARQGAAPTLGACLSTHIL
uniref:Uncharacterized protein n=1 Tax=Meleagris gallopavo TaxID=9103 RepID=G1NDL6_MELGA